MPGDVDDAEIRRFAHQLARAETDLRATQPRSPAVSGGCALAALGFAVLGLLLPWSKHDGIIGNAFTHSNALAALSLLTVAVSGVVVAWCFARPDEDRVSAVRGVVGTGGVISVLSGLVTLGHVHGHEHQWWGPALFLLAVAAAIALAYLPDRQDGIDPRLLLNITVPSLDAARDRVRATVRDSLPAAGRQRWRTPLAVSGVSALAVSAAALTATWEQLSGAVIDELGEQPLVWRGTELASTLALRWVVTVGLALSLAVVVLPRTRRLLPLVLTVTGVAISWLTALRTADIPIRGTNAAIGVGTGAWLTLAAGLTATASGVALFVVGRPTLRPSQRRFGRPAVAAAAVVALVLPMAALSIAPGVSRAGEAAGDDIREVLPPASATDAGQRLGETVEKASFATNSSGSGSVRRDSVPILAGSLGNKPGTWFVDTIETRYAQNYVIYETVRGRVLPLTVISGAADLHLLGVAQDSALIVAKSDYDEDVVSVIDLHRASSTVNGGTNYSNRGSGTAVLSTVRTSRTSAPGQVVGERLAVDVLADGSAVVTVDSKCCDAPPKSYRVDAATVRGTAPWRLGAALPPGGSLSRFYGPDGSIYDTHITEPPSIFRLGSDGVQQPVVGNVRDASCTLSRDPLSSSLADQSPDFGNSVLDRSGNLWTLLTGHTPGADSVLYVLTKDGVLRRLADARWADVRGIQIASDGALYVTTQDVRKGAGSTYRITRPDELARATRPLPPVAAGCITANTAEIDTAGRRATAVATVSTGSAGQSSPVVVDAIATTVQVRAGESTGKDNAGHPTYRYSIVRTVAGQRSVAVYTSTTARVRDVIPDGRGGAWWSEVADEKSLARATDSVSLGYISPGGTARVVARNVTTHLTENHSLQWAPDPHDGSLWWQVPGAPTWKRTTAGGATDTLAYHGVPPVFGGGAGYAPATAPDKNTRVVHRLTGTQLGPAILGSDAGRNVLLSAGVAAHLTPADFSVDGSGAVTAQGQYLLYQAGWLARVEPSGQIRLLAGPADGFPSNENLQAMVVVGAQLMITLASGKVYRVDVS